MEEKLSSRNNFNIRKDLKIDCEKYFGFCCVALYFSKMDGFPKDKVAGEPCPNLKENFMCKIHKNLSDKGLKGCTTYDCFGAGQKVASSIYKGKSWKENPSLKNEMFEVFLIIRQFHEILWYLSIAYDQEKRVKVKGDIKSLISEIEGLTLKSGKEILSLNIELYRDKANGFLKEVYSEVSRVIGNRKQIGKNNIARNLSKQNLSGIDLSGSLLIASNLSNTNLTGTNLIGADMRDTNIKGTNLEKSLFITQQQINSTIGDDKTKLPPEITRPSSWRK